MKEARQACEHTLRERNAIEQDHMKIEQEYTDKLDIANKHITQLEQNRDNIQHSYQTNLQTLKDHHVDTIRQLDSSVTQWQIKYQQMHQKYNSMLQEYTEYRNTVQTRLSDSMMTHVGVQTYTPVPVAMISVGTETDSDMLPTVAPAESLPINQPIAESSCVGVVRSHHRYSSSKIEEIVPDDTNEDNLDDGVDVEGDEDDGFESLHLQSLGQHRSLARSASTTTLMKPATRKQHSHKLTTEAISTKKTGQSKSQMDYIEEQDEDVFSLASSTHSSNYGEGDDYSGSSNTSSGNEFLSSANTDDPVNRSIEEHMVEEIAELMATRAQLKHAKQTLKEQTQALKKEKYKWKDHKSGKRAVSKSDALALARDWNQRTEALNESMQQINETTDRVRHREKVLRVALGAFADDTHTDWLLYTPYSTPSQHLGKSVNSIKSSSIPHHTRSTRQYLATSQELETDEDDVNARNHMTATSSLLKQALQLQLKSHASPNRYRENSRNQSELPSSQSEPHVLMPVRLLHAARSGSPFVDTSAAYIYTHPHPHHTGTSVTNGSAAANHNTHIESHLNRVDPTSLHQRSRRLREEVNSFAEKQEASSRIFDEHSR